MAAGMHAPWIPIRRIEMPEEWVVKLREGKSLESMNKLESGAAIRADESEDVIPRVRGASGLPVSSGMDAMVHQPGEGECPGGRARHADVTRPMVGQARGGDGHLAVVDSQRPPLSLVERNVGRRRRAPE